jgi:hypothetical protein
MQRIEPAGGRSRWPMPTLALAFVAMVAMVIPATAAAHPGVFEVDATIREASGTCVFPAEDCLTIQPQYAVANDGWAKAFKEDNGIASSGGMINYKAMPGTWRAPMTPVQKLEFPAAQTGLQPHATCTNVAALDAASTVLAWQGPDPFYGYIPWQKASAGLGDEPAEWLPVVEEKTGVDLSTLSTVAEFEAACESLDPGALYVKADTALNSITTAEVAAAVASATEPLQGEISLLTGEKGALQKAIESWKANGAAVDAQKQALVLEKQALGVQVDSLKKANAKKAKTIKGLRRQLKAARNG